MVAMDILGIIELLKEVKVMQFYSGLHALPQFQIFSQFLESKKRFWAIYM